MLLEGTLPACSCPTWNTGSNCEPRNPAHWTNIFLSLNKSDILVYSREDQFVWNINLMGAREINNFKAAY